MKEKDHDYSPFLFFIYFFVMLLALSHCSVERTLDRIDEDLKDINYELKMMRYK